MKNNNSLKKRIIQFLFNIGKKCRLLAYPITFFVVVFLAIYHTVRKILVEKQYHTVRRVLLAFLCVAVIISAVVVLPTWASETGEEPTTEVVSEEELDPAATPKLTPQITENAEESDQSEEKESESADSPKDDLKDEKKEEEADQPSTEELAKNSTADEEDSDTAPFETEQKKDEKKQEEPALDKKEKRTPNRKAAATPAPVKLEKPTYQITADGTGVHTYPLDDKIKLSIKASAPAGAGIDYQWYIRTTPDGQGEALNGNGALTSSYSVPEDSNAGEYYYYCGIKSVDNDGYNIDSDEVYTSNIVVTIGKGEPSIEDFDISAIEDDYPYTGEYINPSIVSSRDGMGKAYIVIKDGNNENRPKAESSDPYPIYLRVSEGSNYKAKTIDLNKSITVSRIPKPRTPYTIKGTKGKVVDGKQWYTSAVSIVPFAGFGISTSEDNFQSELVYDSDGKNQGPAKSVIYLRNNSNKGITSPITVTQKRDGQINIDTSAPTATIEYDKDAFSQNAINAPVSFSLAASDAVSGIAKKYYYVSKQKITESQLKGLPWKEWEEGKNIAVSDDSSFVLCAKVEDAAGNASYTMTDMLTVDQTMPLIKCGKKNLEDEKTYVADKKSIEVSDEHLKRVVVERNGEVTEDKSGSDIGGKSVDITLNGPSNGAKKVVYVVSAEDIAGNKKVTTITLNNPVLEVDAIDLDFGSGEDALTYGYSEVEPKEVLLKTKDTQEKVNVDLVEIEAGDAFEIVKGSNKIRPKSGLHAGTYEAVLRIYYNGEEEATSTCRCAVTVKPATMLVRYTGQQDVGYHSYPDLQNTIEFTESDFKNGDTVASLKADTHFVMPVLYYQDEEGNRQPFTSDMRALKSLQLIPGGGQASDYVFEYGSGQLEVKRHSLRRGYVISGDKVEGNDWYISSTVAIRPAEGYAISQSDDESSFASAEQFILVNGPTLGKQEKFYVMDMDTGEISAQLSENVKIDNTAPRLRNGEGITVSSDILNSIGNAITFGIFFNDTKSVSISATDEESGIKTMEYCVSQKTVGADGMDSLNWQRYDGGFTISPEDYERAVIYAKITNHAGLVTYISSKGMVFDNKQPDINYVQNGKEHGIVDEKEYITEEFALKVSDRNLKQATLFAGTNTAVTGSALQITGNEESVKEASCKISCPKDGSRTYTVVASDGAGNNAEREFTITKPVYDIDAKPIRIKSAVYGYETAPQATVNWANTDKANANATISDVEISNTKHFEVKQDGKTFWIAAKSDLAHGNYTTDVTLVYNGGKKVETTCSFSVEKATLTAAYVGDDRYYHEKVKDSSVKVTGFVKHKGVVETPETAAGYEEPVVQENELAKETKQLTPSGGKADNYKFDYKSGLLLVDRRHAVSGKDGQYTIEGKMSSSGWYTGDIVIRPKSGFALLDAEDDTEAKDSITLSEDTDNGQKTFYITNAATGEIYYPSALYYKKDAVIPDIQGIEDEKTYNANKQEVTVTDDYLTSVTVNGEAKQVEQGKAVFTLTASQEKMVYVVIATDCAGNVNNKTIVMKQPESIDVVPDDKDETASTAPTSEPQQAGNSASTDVCEGIVKKMVKVIQGAPNVSLTTNSKELKSSVLSDGEVQAVGEGSDADIELRIRNIDSNVPQQDKELIIANLSGYSIGEYMDITLWKKVGSSSQKKVTDTNKPISITVTIPKELQDASRQYAMLRIHDGAVSILRDRDSAANTVTFMTDKFSTYVLAYRQGTKHTSSTASSRAGSRQSGGKYVPHYDASPDMGDQAPVLPVAITFITALLAMIVTIIVRKRIQGRSDCEESQN